VQTPLDLTHYATCLRTLRRAWERYQAEGPDGEDAELYRSACVKEFELLVEIAGKLLKKRLRPYLASHREADMLPYKEVFRRAALFDLLPLPVAERWLAYRDVRNETAHDYGAAYANRTLALLPDFIPDADAVHQALIVNGQ